MTSLRSLSLLVAVFCGMLSVLHLVDRVQFGMAVCASPAACPLGVLP